ncbi:MAG: hypothetical protein NVS4B1_25500 [Ktedonobacteraceae bacterium]
MIEQPENLRLGDLIAKRVPFKVPKYQRAYAWDVEEIEDYIRDLKEIYEAHNSGGDMTHFFGGIVSFEERAPNTTTRRIYNVIDGQQRLATFMIAIALLISELKVLVSEANSQGDLSTAQAATSHSEKIRRDFLEYDEVIANKIQQKPRLTLSKADADFFAELVAGRTPTPTRDSHRRLKNAWDSIHEFVSKYILDSQTLSAVERLRRLLLLQSCLTEECYVILIVSDNKDEAYRLFSILNDRGKTLSDGDKLRSYTLEFLENHQTNQDRVEKSWDAILGYKESAIDEFLRTYYPSYEGLRAPSRDLSDSFLRSTSFFSYSPRPLNPGQTLEARQIEDRIANMRGEQEVFVEISDGDWPGNCPNISQWDQMRISYLGKLKK